MIKDPLTHMVRNSADHGLETPAERRAAGKPEKGTHPALAPISRAATSSSRSPTTDAVSTLERISAKAVARGLASAAELDKMSEAQIQQIHLHAGLFHRRAR